MRMLVYQCDSCKNLDQTRLGTTTGLPVKWMIITIDEHLRFTLCPQCAKLPMRFGNIDLNMGKP